MAGDDELQLVGTAEVAELLGVEKPRIGRWMRERYPLLPEPVARLASGPVWRLEDIEKMKVLRAERMAGRG